MLTAIAVLATCVLVAPAAQARSKVSVAVLDLEDRGVGAKLAANLRDLISTELSKLSIFSVISSKDVENMISVEQQKQLLGCDDASCIAEIAGALGADYMCTGNVGKIGDVYLVNLQLINQKNARVEAREEVKAEGDQVALIEGVQDAARKLVRPVLKAREGFLMLKVSESGSNVYVDDKLIGVTPLRRTPVSWGPHTLRVEKQGFITFAKDIEVQSDQTASLDVSLIPSPDFIEAYESRNYTLWYLAWISTGLTLASAGAAIGFELDGQKAEDDHSKKLRGYIADGRARREGGNFVPVDLTDAELRELQDLADQGEQDTVLARTFLGIGAGTAIAAVVLFIVMDNPFRYEDYKLGPAAQGAESGGAGDAPAPSVVLTPAVGPTSLGLTLQF